MKGTPSSSSSRPVKSKKKKNENSSSCNLLEEMLLSTIHEILKENYETLQRDHASLEENFKHVSEMNDLMKFHFQNQTKELEEQNRDLLEEFERERCANEKHKKKIEEMEIKNQELLIAKEKKEEELKKIENKYKELTEEFIKVEKECSELKEAKKKNLMVQEEEEENIVVVDHDMNKTVTEKFGDDESKDLKTKKIFVGGIPKTVTEDELKEFFAKYGTVVEQQIIRDRETKMSRGFGFVVFDKEQVVDELLSKGNMIDMANTQVEIKKAVPMKPSPPPMNHEPRGRYGGPYGGFDGGYGLIRPHGAPASRFAWGYGYRNETPLGYGGEGGGDYGGGGAFESGGPYGKGYSRYHPYAR